MKMGRKSKMSELIRYIKEKNYTKIDESKLRVSKREIIANLNISRSTMYNLVGENPLLEIKGDEVVYSRDEYEHELLLDLFNRIYEHYDPEIGQKELSMAQILTKEEKESPEKLEDIKNVLRELEEIYTDIKYSTKYDEISFTTTGAQSKIGSNEKISLCNICLKPLTNQLPTLFSTSTFEFEEKGNHCTCYFKDWMEGEWTNYLICAYCGVPLSPIVYEKHLIENKFAYMHTPTSILGKMHYEWQSKLVKIATKNFQERGSEILKEIRTEYKENIKKEKDDDEIATKSNIERWRKGEEEEEIFPDTSWLILEKFFEDFKTGELRVEEELAQECIIHYQIAEYQVRREQKEEARREMEKFFEFTGIFPTIITDHKFLDQDESLINSNFPYPWKNTYGGYTEENLHFHPKCWIRYHKEKIEDQNESNKEDI